MIRELGRSARDAVMEGVGWASSRYQENKPLPVDLLESDEEYLAVFDAPGVRTADVAVQFDRNTLSVRIDRFRDIHQGFDLRIPGRGMSLDGEVRLPADAQVDPDAASAVITSSGTLEVHVPKAAEHTVDIDDRSREDTAGRGSGNVEPVVDSDPSDSRTDATGSGPDPASAGPDEVGLSDVDADEEVGSDVDPDREDRR